MTYLREQGKYARESLNVFLPEKVDLRYINLYESLMNGTSREFFDLEYKKYINESENLKDLLSSLELANQKGHKNLNVLNLRIF